MPPLLIFHFWSEGSAQYSPIPTTTDATRKTTASAGWKKRQTEPNRKTNRRIYSLSILARSSSAGHRSAVHLGTLTLSYDAIYIRNIRVYRRREICETVKHRAPVPYRTVKKMKLLNILILNTGIYGIRPYTHIKYSNMLCTVYIVVLAYSLPRILSCYIPYASLYLYTIHYVIRVRVALALLTTLTRVSIHYLILVLRYRSAAGYFHKEC